MALAAQLTSIRRVSTQSIDDAWFWLWHLQSDVDNDDDVDDDGDVDADAILAAYRFATRRIFQGQQTQHSSSPI